MSEHNVETPRDICQLDHAMFSKLGEIMFRRSLSDGTPMMILPFGEREAGLPLRSLQHAFGIADESPDGQMLGRIAESLDYVHCLRPGDPLPAEVINGQASWEPAVEHRRTAATRLRLQLLGWIDPSAAQEVGAARDIETLLESNPAIRGKVQAAGSEAVVALVERLGEELAFIEALRELLLSRVQVLVARVGQMVRGAGRIDYQRREDMTQVLRLATIALNQFRSRFAEVDVQTGEIIATLRNADGQIAYIRSNRDVLYRSLRAWQPALDAWRKADGAAADIGPVVATTYQFLAQRYLPTSEWPTFNSLRQARASRKPERTMIW